MSSSCATSPFSNWVASPLPCGSSLPSRPPHRFACNTCPRWRGRVAGHVCLPLGTIPGARAGPRAAAAQLPVSSRAATRIYGCFGSLFSPFTPSQSPNVLRVLLVGDRSSRGGPRIAQVEAILWCRTSKEGWAAGSPRPRTRSFHERLGVPDPRALLSLETRLPGSPVSIESGPLPGLEMSVQALWGRKAEWGINLTKNIVFFLF